MGNMADLVTLGTRQKIEMRGICVRLFRYFCINKVCLQMPAGVENSGIRAYLGLHEAGAQRLLSDSRLDCHG